MKFPVKICFFGGVSVSVLADPHKRVRDLRFLGIMFFAIHKTTWCTGFAVAARVKKQLTGFAWHVWVFCELHLPCGL